MASEEFPKAGIRFSFIINEFIPNVCHGESNLRGMTTAEVCEKIIMPETFSARSSYCDILRSENHPGYGESPTVFISHAHSYQFLDVVGALEYHLRANIDTVIWFDLFSINQHITTDWSFDWLSTTFKSAIGRFGRIIMVMSPWNNPLPFTRAWCVFEAYCASVTNSEFDIALSQNDEKQFLKDVRKGTKESINKMLTNIRSKNSQCTKEDDRQRIFAVIRNEVGFSELDSMVFERYRKWVIEIAEKALEACNSDEDQLSLCSVVGQLSRPG